MQKYGSFFFVLIFIVFMLIARMSETLVCEPQSESSIKCERIQDRIFYESHRKYEIVDLNSIELHKRKIRRRHNITAISSTGKKIVLLSVPEKDFTYTNEIISKLKALPRAEEKKFEFTRNEMHSQLLLLSIAGLVVLVCIGYLLKSKNGKRKHS